ncbi:phytanoyl-CoA dioxygenase family protein [Actinomadura namibiensis]|uniref:Ectoine hydroxylase-related dioxygenase (Phytanoyl-CoA dioxygenase family) n=1 Tax=Actinomadura namibiensis TaxID=182080 RepID=A0A7W3LRK1_ACTNM|nr:phytanoyl-CoA dioxygenase family protein [Actinomadura namibiensis]MBA8952973.1 ectoine hydroxylase-related dioxygenase (phytanoyl-CoA dioxygenase family) [Actinomadura namibiensis]
MDVMEKYETDGYAIFRNVLDADLVAEADAHVRWLQEHHPGRSGEDLSTELVAADPFWVRLVSDDRLLDIAQLFVGPDIALFASHYIAKPPYTGKAVLWHQDGAFWPLDPMRVVTLWLAVDRSTPENGCLRVIPGSHRQGLHGVRERAGRDAVFGVESDVAVDESRAVDMVLEPGDVEVHHPNIMHGSNANTSPHRRCGLTIRYIPTSTRITAEPQPFPSALLLRGEPGVNLYRERPRYREGEHFPFAGSERWI